MSKCPCSSEKDFSKCCEPYLKGENLPPTPEALMRSRYSAYVVGDIDYVEQTMTGKARKVFDKKESAEWSKTAEWQKLEIIDAPELSTSDTDGIVEFIAYYNLDGKDETLHERSKFIRVNNKWLYIDGSIDPIKTVVSNKLGRNDPCSCGSGKKYKKCCY